jgi:hypothetical protein
MESYDTFGRRRNVMCTVSTWMNCHFKEIHRTVESRSQQLISIDETNCNVMVMLILICSGLCGALVKNCNATEVQVPINKIERPFAR